MKKTNEDISNMIQLEAKNILDLTGLDCSLAIDKMLSSREVNKIIIDNIDKNYVIPGYDLSTIFDKLALFLTGKEQIHTLSIKLHNSNIATICTQNFIDAINAHENIKNVTFQNVMLDHRTGAIKSSSIQHLEILDEQFSNNPNIQLFVYQNPKLKYLHIGGCFPYEKFDLIKEINPNLKFKCKFLGNELFINEPILNLNKYESHCIDANARNEKITCVTYDSTTGGHDLNKLDIFFKHFLKENNFKNLKSIIFKDCYQFSPYIQLIIQEMKNYPSISKLVLKQCNINDLSFLKSKIVALDCSNNPLLSNYDSLKTISYQNPNLKFINWDNNNCESNDIMKIMEENKICILVHNTMSVPFNQKYFLPPKTDPVNAGNNDNNPDTYNTTYLELLQTNLKLFFKEKMKFFLLCIYKFNNDQELAKDKIIIHKVLKMKILDEMINSTDIKGFLAGNLSFEEFTDTIITGDIDNNNSEN